MWKPLARRLLASEVFDQLRARILRGEMAPGAPLPAERSLATLLQVNRNAVREGLKRLEQAGLVAIQQGGATRVLDFRRTAGLELLATMLVDAEGTIDTRIVRGIVELRTALAPVVGRFAAQRAKSRHVVALRKVVAAMAGAGDDTAQLARLALDFWAEVVSATDNLALELAFNSLAVSYGSVLDHLRHVMAGELRAVDHYEALVDAIAAGDEEAAARRAIAIVTHGDTTFRRVTQVVDAAQAVTKRRPTKARRS
ncbi:MAG TPA: GntR family transcriptional regulator [Labilithrix sp.]|nr:GntR family transcriptional regulator [Labilithrix sp.]